MRSIIFSIVCVLALVQSTSVLSQSTLVPVKSLKGHTGEITSVAVSPDGTRVVTGSRDRTARIWEAATGRLLKILKGHTREVASVAFSPDGKQVITGSLDTTARIWDAISGDMVQELKGHEWFVKQAAFAPDRKQVATVGWDNAVKIWDARTGKTLQTLTGHTSLVNTVTYSPDGKWIATGGFDHMVKLWDAKSGNLVRTMKDFDRVVSSVAFSPDSKRLAVGIGSTNDDSTAGRVDIWEVHTGQKQITMRGYSDEVDAVAFSPDGKLLVSGDTERQIILWNAHTGERIASGRNANGFVYSVAFFPDGKHVVASGEFGVATIWKTVPESQKDTPLKIGSISIIGNKYISTVTILTAAQLRKGDLVTQETLKEVQSRIMETGFFGWDSRTPDDAVNITHENEGGEPRLVIKVKENPLIRKIEFMYLQPLRSDQLRKVLTLKPGSVYNHNTMIKEANSLEKVYEKHGYIGDVADVTISSGVLRITIRAIKVAEIKVYGNTRIPSRVITDMLGLKLKDYYNEKKLLEGRRRLYNSKKFEEVTLMYSTPGFGIASVGIIVVEKEK